MLAFGAVLPVGEGSGSGGAKVNHFSFLYHFLIK
jgi:hypothetical protein